MPYPPDIDLVIAFRTTREGSVSKKQTREEARKAEQQYERLVNTLTFAGLKAVGRRGESLGHILVFVVCPPNLVVDLVKRERYSDFLEGLPIPPAKNVLTLSPADRIRLVHSYISSTPADGGLGVSPDAPDWDCVESIFPLHDRHFNEVWVRSWKPSTIASIQLEKIREQFGDSLAYYFAFLASYTQFLIFPAILGILAHFFLPAYSPFFSIFLCIWSAAFVEWWRIRERKLGLRFGTRGSFRVEKCRAQYKPGMSWWSRDLRILASLPVILICAALLSALLTGIFVFEAFITKLYQGPGKNIVAFSPTILFLLLCPRFLAIYHSIAVRLTNWENHAHKSTYNASLTLKIFALGSIVAYLALCLSAFVYVPFGEGVMLSVQTWLFSGQRSKGSFGAVIQDLLNGTFTRTVEPKPELSSSENVAATYSGLWDVNTANVRAKLNPSRLREQMFAYTVTNQVINSFIEVGLPYILRWVANLRNKKGNSHSKNSKPPVTGSHSSTTSDATGTPKKRVVFEDEKERGGLEERAFLDRVRHEAALPEYDLFVDYNEMVVQFGYVALWSTIWPLAGAMAFVNNLLEFRSDAFKMTVHYRRPIPTRTDTIGPWMDALMFLTWLTALMNATLVYLFSPQLMPTTWLSILTSNNVSETVSSAFTNHTEQIMATHLVSASGGLAPKGGRGIDGTASPTSFNATKDLLLKAALIALLASHGFILLRLVVRHVAERTFWFGSKELEERDREIKEAREGELKGTASGAAVTGVEKVIIERGVIPVGGAGRETDGDEEREKDEMMFWEEDEGIEEIRRILKEA